MVVVKGGPEKKGWGEDGGCGDDGKGLRGW